MLLKSSIISQLDFYPMVWMCHGRGLNNKINNIYKRTVTIVYQDKKSSFETSLKRDKSTSILMKKPPVFAYWVILITYRKSRKKFLFFKKMKLTI